MTKPRLFIGSSSEQLELARAARANLAFDVEVSLWSGSTFQLSKSNVESLLEKLARVDFGLFILAPDDELVMRDKASWVVRDNVLFELGMFVGRLGREHTFYFVPRGAAGLHLPSDLVGMEPATYETNRSDNDLVEALGPACDRVQAAIRRISGHAKAESPGRPKSASEVPVDSALGAAEWNGLSRVQQLILRVWALEGMDKGLSMVDIKARLPTVEGISVEVAVMKMIGMKLRLLTKHSLDGRPSTYRLSIEGHAALLAGVDKSA